MPLTVGSRLGTYEILGALGSGGMGEVYRARDSRLARQVAIKALPDEFARDPQRLARFRREAQTLAGLNHPNIAAIYGLEEEGTTPHLVLELVEGETLAVRLKHGPLPPRDAIGIGIQIANAVEAAHERGIVHRDLKPGNVMIGINGRVKVLDFGIAKSDPVSGDGSHTAALTAPDATAAGVVLGTAAYMSPEQARGHATDRRSDVWSFGCVLFECYTGRPAFTGETASDLIARILEREPDWKTLPESAPPRVREILRRCLRKNADERPRDIRDVRLELEDVASGRGTATTAPENSIAVLPFENLSGADDEYFADGITEEILNALAQVDGLRVAARASCFAFKGRREDLRAIGDKLDVTTVLEGTVRRAGSRLRITAQLAKAADGYQLWSERYDREMTDVFAIQDEIATAIASRLRLTLQGDAEKSRVRGTKNLEAYELVLRGRALQAKRGRFMVQAVRCFERAIALDPQYADALASLSDSYRLIGTFGVAPMDEAMSRARALAERALEIDPELVEPWSTLAAVAEQYDRDFAQSDEMYERALRSDPRDARTRAQWAMWRAVRASMPDDRAAEELRRAVQDDPLNAWVGAMNAYLLGVIGRYDEAIAEAERSVDLDPESFFAQWSLMRSYALAGHFDRAIAMAPSIMGESGRHSWALGLLGWAHAKSGRRDLARACYDELEARSRQEFAPRAWLGSLAASAGLEDAAIRWLETAVKEGDPLVIWFRRIPFWDFLHGHPRFEEILRQAEQPRQGTG